jgi:hypothetical protein
MSGNINYVVASQKAQAALLKRIADTQADNTVRLTRIEAKLDAIEATLASISPRLPAEIGFGDP